jgi:PAS domain S-box-containing protein
MSGTGHLSELESLRLQVADLVRELAERDRHLDRNLQDQSEQSDLLRTIVEGTAADTGEEFFRSLVRHLAQALNVRYAFVGEWREQASAKVRTLAVWSGTDFLEPFEYDPRNTPCTNVIGRQYCLYESGVQRLFPEDHLLVQLEVDSYCGMPLFDKSGKPLGLLVVMDDRPITRAPLVNNLLQIFGTRAAAELQRQQGDENLRESERRLRLTQFALDHAQDSVLWADDSKRFVYANEAACRSLGYSKEELLRLSIPDIAPHHDPARLQQRLEEIRQGGAATLESLHRRRDGTEFPVETSITHLEHEGKVYTCGVIRDITERKRIEEERLQALCDLQNIMETVPDVMFTLDIQGNLVNWNRRLGDVTGYSPEELLNKPALAFVPAEERDRTASSIQQAFTEGYAELDGYMLTKDLRAIPYHWTGALLKNSRGEPIGITGIGRDVSDKKRAEEELKQQRRRLVDVQAIAHLGSWEWDIGSGEVRWSDELYRIFGHEPGSIRVTYDTFLTALLPDDHDLVLAAINNALTGKTPYDIEYRIVRPNGDVRIVHARGDVHRDATGDPLSIAGAVLDITERRQVEEALRASEERWQLAVRSSNDGIWDWNIQTGDIFFSSRWKSMRGFEDHEIKNHVDEWRSRIHPDDLDRVLQRIDAYLAKQSAGYSEEYRVQRKDGSYMWILDRGVALWADDGTPTRMVGSECDITTRKRAEEARQESEERFNYVIEATSDGIWDWNVQTGVVYFSPQWMRLLGYSPAEVSPTVDFFLTILHPEDKARTMQVLQEHMEGRTLVKELEIRLRQKSGEYQWFLDRGKVVTRDKDGSPTRMVSTIADITERKQAEETLRESEERCRLLTEATFDGIAIHDQGILIVVNPGLEKMFGYGPGELIGKHILDIVADESREMVIANMRTGVSGPYESVGRRKDGSTFYGEVVAKPYRYNGREVCLVAGRDITERKTMEAELKLSESRLTQAQRVAHIGSWELDIIANQLWWSDEVFRIFEIAPMRFGASYEAFLDIVHPEDRQFVDRSYTESLASRIPYSIEHRLLLPDGRIKRVHERCESFYNTAGKPIRSLGTVQDITERKQAEESLRVSEERFKLAVRGSNTGIWDWDLRTNKTYFSPLWKSMLGYEEHELRGEFSEWEERLHPDDRERALATVRAYLDGTTPQYELEHRLRHKDESYRWILARGVLLSDAEGKPFRMAGSHIDITEQKQTQEALAQSERQLRTVLNALPVGVWFTDATGKIRLTNPAGRRIWAGVQRVGLESTESHPGWSENVSSSGEPHRWALARALTKGEATLNEELTIRCLDGTSKVIINSAVPLFGENGQVSGAIIVNQDITERKALERNRAQTQAFLQSILENIPHIITVKDAKTLKLVQMNRAAEQVLGLDRHALADNTLYDCLPEKEANALWAADLDALQRRTFVEVPEHVVKREGERDRIFRTKKASILDAEGEPQYILTISEDITERKRAEHVLRDREAALARFKSTLDQTHDCVFMFAPDSLRFLYCNRGAVEQVGYSEAELFTMTPLDLQPEFTERSFREMLQPLRDGRMASYVFEAVHRHKDSHDVAMEVSLQLVREDGQEGRFVAVVRDITERKQLAEREVSRVRQLKKLYELSMTLPGDPGVVFEHVVRAIGELFNVQVVCLSEIVDQELYFKSVYVNGQTLTDAGHCSLAITPCATVEQTKDLRIFDRVMERFPQASFLRDHQAFSYCGFPALNNERRVVAVTCLLDNKPHEFSKEEQDLLRIFGQRIAVEIERSHHAAEQKRAADELRSSHAFIRQIIDANPNFIFVKDRDGRFTLVNKAVADAYGTTVDFLIGKTDADFDTNLDEVDFFRMKDLEVMDSLQERFIAEEAMTDSTGRTRWLQTIKRPILDEQGRAIMVLGAATDITERKRMEETLRQRERDLHAALEERARISQDLHDGILQSLFAVGLTLEASKSMMSQRNRKTSGPPLDQAIDQLNRVMREIRNFIAGLGSDLLQGKDLPTALQHMLESLTQTQSHATHVRLAVEDRAAQAVSAEQALHLFHVIQEAVSNCIRHGRAQEASVSLKMLKQGVRLSIRDNGRGFNPKAAKGIGHGLSNMAARAQKIGGRFTVLSKVNEGTRIVLDLPKEAPLVHH